jgi:hypothetical protein
LHTLKNVRFFYFALVVVSQGVKCQKHLFLAPPHVRFFSVLSGDLVSPPEKEEKNELGT